MYHKVMVQRVKQESFLSKASPSYIILLKFSSIQAFLSRCFILLKIVVSGFALHWKIANKILFFDMLTVSIVNRKKALHSNRTVNFFSFFPVLEDFISILSKLKFSLVFALSGILTQTDSVPKTKEIFKN